jgi:hypothetical protein
MTALYNVLKKERRNEDLDKSERDIHDKGLVGVLKELHDELDAVVLLSRVTLLRRPRLRVGAGPAGRGDPTEPRRPQRRAAGGGSRRPRPLPAP